MLPDAIDRSSSGEPFFFRRVIGIDRASASVVSIAPEQQQRDN